MPAARRTNIGRAGPITCARSLPRPHGPGQVFDNYIQVARDERGLMLGWRSINEGLVQEGLLAEWPGSG